MPYIFSVCGHYLAQKRTHTKMHIAKDSFVLGTSHNPGVQRQRMKGICRKDLSLQMHAFLGAAQTRDLTAEKSVIFFVFLCFLQGCYLWLSWHCYMFHSSTVSLENMRVEGGL